MSVVTLHVGLMKTGTTTVQRMIFDNRDRLAEVGISVPGKRWNEQMSAVRSALGSELGPEWTALSEPMRAGDGHHLMSMEFLGPARPPVIRRIVRSLRPATVRVVISVRDLNRSLLSLWQETIRNGRAWTLEEYVDGARVAAAVTGASEVPEAGRTFWRQMDAAAILGRWVAVADECVVVTVPPPGAAEEVLLGRIFEAIGVDANGLVTPQRANESLGAASLLALLELNATLVRTGVAERETTKAIKQFLAKEVLAGRRTTEGTLGLDVEGWVTVSARAQRSALEAAGVRLIGAWADLAPVSVPGLSVGDVDPAAVEAARTACREALEAVDDQHRIVTPFARGALLAALG